MHVWNISQDILELYIEKLHTGLITSSRQKSLPDGSQPAIWV